MPPENEPVGGIYPPTMPAHAITKKVLGVSVGFAMVNGKKEYFIFDTCASYVIRGLAREGWDIYRLRRLMAGLMIPLADSTIRSYHSVGSRLLGRAAYVSPEQIVLLEKVVAENPEVDPWGLPDSRSKLRLNKKGKKKKPLRAERKNPEKPPWAAKAFRKA